ncbi:MAG: hypothetical protein NTV34_09815 [Proteobacteria bacterium]|nr:hypothetical protein [Pseudomonadota bacterium]
MTIGLVIIGLTAGLYFGGTRFLVGHHFFTKYSNGDCIQDRTNKTIFRVQGNAKDSYLCEVRSSGNTIPGSFQVRSSFAISIDETDKNETYSKIECLD